MLRVEGAMKEKTMNYITRTTEVGNVAQLTYGELLDALRACVEESKPEKAVVFDFLRLAPTTIHSWRGSYDEIGIGCARDINGPVMLVADFVRYLEGMLGEILEGWKGGEYIVTWERPVWVSQPSSSCETAIVGVKDDGYQAIIQTWRMDL